MEENEKIKIRMGVRTHTCSPIRGKVEEEFGPQLHRDPGLRRALSQKKTRQSGNSELFSHHFGFPKYKPFQLGSEN